MLRAGVERSYMLQGASALLRIIDTKWHENILINNVSCADRTRFSDGNFMSYEHHLAPAAVAPIERSILVLLLFQESP
jgi:hypothetical protein